MGVGLNDAVVPQPEVDKFFWDPSRDRDFDDEEFCWAAASRPSLLSGAEAHARFRDRRARSPAASAAATAANAAAAVAAAAARPRRRGRGSAGGRVRFATGEKPGGWGLSRVPGHGGGGCGVAPTALVPGVVGCSDELVGLPLVQLNNYTESSSCGGGQMAVYPGVALGMDMDEGPCWEQDNETSLDLLRSLYGNVVESSLDAEGTRRVQEALEVADNRACIQIVEELRGRVRELAESKHANHVLQVAITQLPPDSVAFVQQELLNWLPPAELAKHPYGCRMLERLIEHFPAAAIKPIADGLLADTSSLSRHQYGNFVVQHLMEHGNDLQRRHIAQTFCKDLSLASHQHASGVLDKVLTYGSTIDQLSLAQKLLQTDGLVVQMASLRSGLAPTERLFKVIRNHHLMERAKEQLIEGAPRLFHTKHGRFLLQSLVPDFAHTSVAPPLAAHLQQQLQQQQQLHRYQGLEQHDGELRRRIAVANRCQ
eukprot:TRINITY_DN3667_c0_g1_i1.p1 TRINITY_DN3667_c0_g1~~TRINITY_DN3667_c0_g1_i1.p1  ORF type:complete len:494 (+),score=118.30 TRINITY_DN3667_c0_g1_i1:31-1482(+)